MAYLSSRPYLSDRGGTLEEYLTLSFGQQQLVESRLVELLGEPDGPDSVYDRATDHWTTTAAGGAVLLVYVFRVGRPRLVVLRLIY